ncbi:uncharacterized protein N0V96_009042 [Colletotrichum fioriniae]|uniref:uncharacterized protein n=1 Tax=Colletotrichum fioriniae TaxID=710243 RepID=UPI0032DB7E00|nr:hypothetical protein N0V96_009042 [Colletotrichum fioriniae]
MSDPLELEPDRPKRNSRMIEKFDDEIKVAGVVDQQPVVSRSESVQSDSYGSSAGAKTFDKKLLYKLDMRLMIAMFFLNFLSLMGRTNIGAALIRQLPQDLHLDAMKVFIVLTMPAAPLVLFEVPSNLLMRFLNRKFNFPYLWYMCVLDILLGQGFVKTFDQMIATRFFVGVFDAGLIPGCIFTVVASLACLPANVGPPEKAKFLTEEEKRLIKNLVEIRSTEIGVVAEWKMFFTNPLNYCWAALYCFTTTTAYSVSIFSPSFVKSFHPELSAADVQAQIVPIFVVAAVACLTTAYAADRLNHRAAFGLGGFIFTIIGYAILRQDEHESTNVTMMALYFIAFGTFITLPMIWILTMQNLQTPFQRAIGSGFVVGVGNTSGYISAWIFKTSDGPYYKNGMIISMILVVIAFAILSATWLYIEMHNRRLEREERLHPSATAGTKRLTGRSFRYKA